MVIGAMHCVRELAETRWPELKGFELQYEGAYICPPLDMDLRTTASDVMLMDETYYERHYNMKLQEAEVEEAKRAALVKIHGKVDMDFRTFWDTIVLSDRELFVTPAKRAWLEANESSIKRVFERATTTLSTTWRGLMQAMHAKFGCSFFAATLYSAHAFLWSERDPGRGVCGRFRRHAPCDCRCDDANVCRCRRRRKLGVASEKVSARKNGQTQSACPRHGRLSIDLAQVRAPSSSPPPAARR